MDYAKYRNKLKEIIEEVVDEGIVPDSALEEFFYFVRDNWGNDDLKLYRYSPADYYNIRNFETGKLRLTNNGVLNDVYEGIPYDEYHTLTPDKINALSELAYLKSFSEDPSNVLMWSHYADKHHGFCVEYDLSLIDGNSPLLNHIFPVVYSEKRNTRSDIVAMAKELKHLIYDIAENNIHDGDGYLDDITSLFLTKGKAWEYEKEWRIVYTKKQIYDINELDLYNYIIPFDYASKVYLGYRMDPTIRKNISEIVQRINTKREDSHLPPITIAQVKLQKDSYDIGFERT